MNRSERGGIFRALDAEDVFLLVAVVALPWFWGGVYLDAYRTAAAFVACAAGLALIRHGASGLGLDRRALWLIPAFLLGAWAFAQTVPLPRTWVAALSPKAASIQSSSFGPEGQGGVAWLRQIEDDARARVPEAPSAPSNRAGALDLGVAAPAPPKRFTLSLQPGATIESAWWYAALLLAFLLVLRRTADDRRSGAYRAILFASFGALAGVGILNRLTAPQRLLWMRDIYSGNRPFGPYVNPSHFAGVMELAVPWLLGFALWGLMHRSEDGRRVEGALALVGAVLGAAAAFLSASKMAAVTIGVASCVLIAVAIRRGRGRRLVLAGTMAAAVLLGAIATFGPLSGRIADFAASHEGPQTPNIRRLIWTAGMRLAGDYTLTGSGFGAFGALFPSYLPRGETGGWSALHNDYLEVYIAGGLVAAALVAWLALAFTIRVVRALRRASDRHRLLPALGLALGLLALTVHEAVDFNLQIPANALLFVVIAAMALAPPAESREGA